MHQLKLIKYFIFLGINQISPRPPYSAVPGYQLSWLMTTDFVLFCSSDHSSQSLPSLLSQEAFLVPD